jgi:hypothetical protein
LKPIAGTRKRKRDRVGHHQGILTFPENLEARDRRTFKVDPSRGDQMLPFAEIAFNLENRVTDRAGKQYETHI